MADRWMRVREAADLMGVSETTVRRRIVERELRGRSGKSGRQEVFLPAKLRRELGEKQAERATATASQTADESALKHEAASVSRAFNDQNNNGQTKPGVASDESAEMIARYERLAGGSLVLAQQRADELNQAAAAAYENLAHARQQMRQLRKVALAGWGTGAVGLVLAFVLSLAFGIGSARSQAAADASRQAERAAAERAQSLRERLAEAEARIDAGFSAQASVLTD